METGTEPSTACLRSGFCAAGHVLEQAVGPLSAYTYPASQPFETSEWTVPWEWNPPGDSVTSVEAAHENDYSQLQ